MSLGEACLLAWDHCVTSTGPSPSGRRHPGLVAGSAPHLGHPSTYARPDLSPRPPRWSQVGTDSSPGRETWRPGTLGREVPFWA